MTACSERKRGLFEITDYKPNLDCKKETIRNFDIGSKKTITWILYTNLNCKKTITHLLFTNMSCKEQAIFFHIIIR